MDKSVVTITCIKNPFAPKTSQEVRTFPVGRSIKEYIGEFYPGGVPAGYEVAVAVNGKALHEENRLDLVIASGGLHLAFCSTPRGGHGKNIGAIIAMIAVVIISVSAPYLAPESWGLVTYNAAGVATGLTMTGTLASAGVLVAGGLIVSSVFPATVEMPTTDNLESSSTYGWDQPPNAVQEGAVVPIVYGTARIAPPIVGRYILTEDDSQSLNLLLLVAGCLVDDIPLDEIRINQTYLYNDDGSKNYLGVPPPEIRLGDNDQAVIPYFDETRLDTSVGAKIDDDSTWTTRTTSGNNVEGIGVTLTLPAGLFYANSDGGLSPQTIKVDIEYKKQGDATWTKLKGFNSTPVTIPSGYWTAGFWGVDYSGEEVDFWVELERGSAVQGDHTNGEKYETDYWIDWGDGEGYRPNCTWRWIATTEEAEAGTVGTDWVEITAAQSKPIRRSFYKDGIPAGTYDIRVKLNTALPTGTRYQNDLYWESYTEAVPDDFTYPGTALLAIRALATDQLSGGLPRIDCVVTRSTVPVWTGSAYEDKPADNPAWACYDILHNSDYGGNVDYSRIDFQAFSDWADYCTTKGYTVNLYFDAAQSIRRSLDIVGLLGRGSVFQLGSTFTVVVDKPEDMGVQKFLFTMGNITADSFKIEYLPMDDRANAVEVTYWDAALDYERTVLEVYAADFDAGIRPVNKVQLTLYGCTDRDQAISQAVFYLNCNRYTTITASWDADIDAIACLPGQIVEVSHDVPLWGYSGRLVSATSNTAVLDREVTLYPGITYQLTIRHQDDDARETVYIQGVGTETTTDTLTLASGTWTKTPVEFTNYAFGEENLVSKKFRVMRIGRSGDMRRKIVAIEHYDGIYSDSGTVVAPTPFTYLEQVKDLVATEVWKGGAGTNVVLSWRGSGSKFWIWYRRVSGGPWIAAGTTEKNQYEIINLDYGMSYDFAVSPNASYASGEIVTLALQGKDLPPSDPTFDDSRSSFPVDRCFIYWNAIDDVDADLYEVRTDLNWGNATNRVYLGKSTECIYLAPSASQTFYLKSVDAYGNYSVNYDTLVLTNGIPSAFTVMTEWKDRNITVSWTPIGDPDLKKWEVKFYANSGYTDIRRTVEVTGNQYTYTADQINTDFGPVVPPLTVYIRVIAYDYWDQSRTVDSQVTDVSPNAPTFVNITGSFKMIIIEFTPPGDPNWDVVQVYRSATNDSSTATLVGEVRGNLFWDSGLDSGDTWYYWLKAKSAWGEVSDFDVGQYSGHSATTIKVDTIDIGDEVIGAPQLATSLTFIDVVSSLPSPPSGGGYNQGDVVFYTVDNKLYRCTGSDTWSSEVDSDDLAANSVIAGKIAAGAVGADEIAANAIVTSKMVVTDFTNQIPNPDFATGDTNGWDPWTGSSNISVVAKASAPSGCPTENALKFAGTGSSVSMFSHDKAYTQPGAETDGVVVEPGEEWRISVMAAKDASFSGNPYIIVYYRKNDGTYTNYTSLGIPSLSTSWGTFSYDWTVPADAVRAWIYIQVTSFTAGNVYWTSFRMRRKNEGTLIVDGSIAANHIQSDTILVKHLAVVSAWGKNINIDPNLEAADKWEDSQSNLLFNTDVTAPEGNNYMYNGAGSQSFPEETTYYPVDTSKKYRVRFFAKSVGANGTLYFCLRQYKDNAGTTCDTNSGRSPYKPQAVTVPSAWTEYSYEWGGSDWQTDVRFVRLNFLLNYSGTAGLIRINSVRFEEMSGGDLIVAGSITASHLAVTSLSSITANLGTLTTGLIQSSNYAAPSGSAEGAGMKIDATNGKIEAYGSGQSIGANVVSRSASYMVTIGWYLNPSYVTTHYAPITTTYFLADGQTHYYVWSSSQWKEIATIGLDYQGSDYWIFRADGQGSASGGLLIYDPNYQIMYGVYAQAGKAGSYAGAFYGQSSTSYGVIGSGGMVGGYFQGGSAGCALVAVADATSAIPSHQQHMGAIYGTSGGHYFINVTGGSGYAAWKTLGVVDLDLGSYALADGSMYCTYSSGDYFLYCRIQGSWRAIYSYIS